MAFRYTQVVSILCITSYFDVFNNFCEQCYFLSVVNPVLQPDYSEYGMAEKCKQIPSVGSDTQLPIASCR